MATKPTILTAFLLFLLILAKGDKAMANEQSHMAYMPIVVLPEEQCLNVELINGWKNASLNQPVVVCREDGAISIFGRIWHSGSESKTFGMVNLIYFERVNKTIINPHSTDGHSLFWVELDPDTGELSFRDEMPNGSVVVTIGIRPVGVTPGPSEEE